MRCVTPGVCLRLCVSVLSVCKLIHIHVRFIDVSVFVLLSIISETANLHIQEKRNTKKKSNHTSISKSFFFFVSRVLSSSFPHPFLTED